MARTHFRGLKPSLGEKKEILSDLENKSTKTTERILAELQPTAPLQTAVKEKAIKGNKLEVTLILDEELQNDLNEIQIFLGKPLSKLELFKLMTKEKLEKLRKENATKTRDKARPEHNAQPLRSSSAANSRTPSKPLIREIRSRDQHRCQWKDPLTQKQCTAQFHLQTEHKIPFAKGGTTDFNNLELLCANHNRLRAIEQYGHNKMKEYIPSLEG